MKKQKIRKWFRPAKQIPKYSNGHHRMADQKPQQPGKRLQPAAPLGGGDARQINCLFQKIVLFYLGVKECLRRGKTGENAHLMPSPAKPGNLIENKGLRKFGKHTGNHSNFHSILLSIPESPGIKNPSLQ